MFTFSKSLPFENWSLIALQHFIFYNLVLQLRFILQLSESSIRIHISSPSWVSLPPTPSDPSRSLQSPKLRSLCYTGGSHKCQACAPNLSHPSLPPSVSTCAFSMSKSLFLPCKQRFSKTFIKIIGLVIDWNEWYSVGLVGWRGEFTHERTLCCVLWCAFWTGVRWYLTIWIVVSLMVSHIEYIFMYLLIILMEEIFIFCDMHKSSWIIHGLAWTFCQVEQSVLRPVKHPSVLTN